MESVIVGSNRHRRLSTLSIFSISNPSLETGLKSDNHSKANPETLKKRDNNVPFAQICTTLSVCYLCLSCGTFLGFTSSGIPSMNNDSSFPLLSNHEMSWIGGLGPLGSMLGALLTVPALKYLGTKGTIFYLSTPIMMSSWILITIADSVSIVMISRFVGGIATGLTTAAAPLYVIEIAEAGNRGRLGILPQLLMLIGILISFVIGSLVNWNSHGIICLFISSLTILLFPMAYDTPKYLISKGQDDKALQVLQKLTTTRSLAIKELDRIKTKQINTQELEVNNNNNNENEQKNDSLFRLPVLKSIAIALGIMTFQQLSGINGITFYAVTIFSATNGVSTWGSHIPPIILASVQVLSSLTSSFFIDRVGRKILLLISATITGFSSLIMGFYFYYGIYYESLFWVPLATLLCFCFGFAIGFGPVAWIFISEILPEKIRQTFNPLIMSYTWLCVFIITKTFPLLIPPISISGVFWMYSTFSILGLFFILIFVPETKGKSNEDLENIFNSNNSRRISVYTVKL